MRVLVVDQDPTQLETLCRGLFLMGYDFVGTSSSDEAVDFLHNPNGMSIDLLLTDLTEADAPGHRVLEQVRRKWPNFPVLIIAGLRRDPGLRTLKQMGFRILKKPFDPGKLDRAIQDLVENPYLLAS